MNDKRSEEQCHHDIRRNSQREERNKGPCGSRIICRLRSCNALNRTLSEFLRFLRYSFFKSIGNKGRKDGSSSWQDSQKKSKNGTPENSPFRLRPIQEAGK